MSNTVDVELISPSDRIQVYQNIANVILIRGSSL